MDKATRRKKELAGCVLVPLRGLLACATGKAEFGSTAEAYESNGPGNTIVVKTSDGEFYLVKVQKSGWVEK